MMRDVERLMAMVRAKNIDAFPRAIADALCNGGPCDECPYYPKNPCFDLLYNDVKAIMFKGCGEGEVGMSATERVINDLNVAKLMLCNPQILTPETCVKIGQTINSAIELLKEVKWDE